MVALRQRELGKKQCVSGKVIQLVAEASVLDITAKILGLDGKQGIGLVVLGN
jgi:hypothetical protein